MNKQINKRTKERKKERKKKVNFVKKTEWMRKCKYINKEWKKERKKKERVYRH